jgi:NTP pyrophosphatase (non-canonical NTP hydrolase)
MSTTNYAGCPGSNSFIKINVPHGEEEGYSSEIRRYDVFVALLFKQESFRHMVDHARGGVCEEAGELSTCLKRHVVYNKPLDRANLIEELGDVRFFVQAVMNLFNISEQEVLQSNAEKLAARYKELTYSDTAAQCRADKTGGD